MNSTQLNFDLNSFEKHLVSNGLFEFFGYKMTQLPQALLRINSLLNLTKPSQIIEFGTGHGGLSGLFLQYAKQKNIKFFTYDGLYQGYGDYLNENLKDSFILGNLTEPSSIKEIHEKIKEEMGVNLIVCDALKHIEFNRYAKACKKGDILMVHDYSNGKGDNNFQYVKFLGWTAPQEQWFDLIKESCEENGIISLFNQEMQECLWFVGMKT